MSRTTSSAVGKLIELDSTVPVTVFIDTAAELVDEVCADSDYSDTRLELIERWLAAHFYQIRLRKVTSEKAGDVGQGYTYNTGLMLASTEYGQQAMMLDTAGGLARLSKQMEAGQAGVTRQVAWLGTEG